MKKIGVIGSGIVGETLANGFLAHGHDVMRGTREPAKLADWKAKSRGKASVGTFAETARHGELIVLAVKGLAAEAVLTMCGPKALANKTVMDASNPIAEVPPTNGILRLYTGPKESLMERLQNQIPKARFVKAFSCVGYQVMVNPRMAGGPPTMFICGDHAGAKDEVREVLEQFGWEAEDLGTVVMARVIEPLCILWCIPGFLRNEWTHAFKWLKA